MSKLWMMILTLALLVGCGEMNNATDRPMETQRPGAVETTRPDQNRDDAEDGIVEDRDGFIEGRDDTETGRTEQQNNRLGRSVPGAMRPTR